MSYWIMVITQCSLGNFGENELLAAVTASNFNTLCDQYGLDPVLIQPALEHLNVEISAGHRQPLFVLRYQPKHQPPIVVTEWDISVNAGTRLLADVTENFPLKSDRDGLERVRYIYSVELVKSQLSDMGLLLSYELSRWIAERGSGFVLGLDSSWYRLNPYQAFIPLS